MLRSKKNWASWPSLITAVLLGFLLALFAGRATAQPEVGSHPAFVPDRLIIQLRAGAAAGIQSVLARQDVQSASLLFSGGSSLNGLDRIYRLDLPKGSDVPQAAQALADDPDVEWVEPDFLAYAASGGQYVPSDVTPNDPLLPEQWGLSKIGAPAAWEVTTGSPTVVIAIVDSGLDLSHPDLAGKLWVNPGEIPGNGLDDDNNGFVDDVNGWDFVNEDNNPSDDEGHGTQVAGVATAATDNAVGIAGLCWNCRIMAVKVMNASGVANYSDIAAGVLYAAQKGAKVINLSLGGYSDSHALHAAIQSAVNDYGAVVVGGAGNDHTNARFYPAAYEEVLAVAGTDQNDIKITASNYGDWVDVTAPAVAITTTFMGGDYGAAEGTSFAASFVSGLAGLVRSEHPDWTPALVEAQIIRTADPIDALNPGYEGLLGSGRIDAARAVTDTPQPILAINATAVNGDPLGRPVPGESATLQVTLGNDWLDATGVQGVLSTADAYVTVITGTASFGNILSGGAGMGSPLFTFNVASGAGYNHPIQFNLHVTANSGTYSVDLPLTLTTRSGNQNVGGTIGADTTWTNDKTYIVVNNVGVAPSVTLTIQAGTVVRFNGDYSLNVGGALIAGGTESQPIRFMSNTGGSWGLIYFDDTSLDATADISGTYQSGNLLSYVQIEGASQGIGCNNATPYISHVTTDGGGMNCTTGITPVFVMSSHISGEVVIGSGSRWRSRASMPTPRYGFGVAAASNGKIYAIGGWDSHNFLATVEEYDPATDTWTSRENMPTARYDLGVAAAGNGKIYAIGGNNGIELSTVEEYDPATDIWTSRASMPTPRYGLGVVLAPNGKIYAIGGIDIFGELGQNEEYDPATDTWASRASMPTKRRCMGVAAASNGKIYVMGGRDYLGIIATVEEYDTATDTWTTRASMPTARWLLGSATAPNQKIYAIGGYNDLEYLTTVEEYGPATNTWMSADSMPTGRDLLGVVTASNGKIYAIGGVNYGGNILTVVEEFTPPLSAFVCRVQNTVIHDGSLSLPQTAQVLATIVGGSITAGTSSAIQNTTASGSITLNGGGVVIDSVAGETISLNNGTVQNTTVSGGGISIGSGSALSNTLTGGGIIAGDGSLVRGNSIENSPGWGVQASGTVDILKNRLVGNASGLQTYSGLVRGNLIANSSGVGLEINGNTTVISNTFTGNAGNAILVTSGSPVIHGNNLEFNQGAYDLVNNTANDIDAHGNWWGTTDPIMIDQRIFDYNDDYTKGVVQHAPAETGPIQNAPPYVRGVTVTPDPVGIETAVYDVLFSKEMDNAIYPEMLFGQSYWIIDNHQWLSLSQYRASYDITSLIPRDTYAITVTGAIGSDGIEIAPNTAYTFTVDYAGGVGDITPPSAPTVEVCAASTPDALSASWSAFDPDSNITLYQYAIGTTEGGTDVVNWTTTSEVSFTRSGLILIAGQTYYISVKARNAGGLWSPAASAGVVAGSGLCKANAYQVYLPVVRR